MITTVDIFEEFFQKVKQSESISDIYREYGGSSIYVPSYKSVCRNEDILKDYDKAISNGESISQAIRKIANEYDLSVSQVYAITKDVREPSLFD